MRFVVLLHTDYGPPHFDLMFEISGESGAGRLMTFRASRWPVEAGDLLERLPDHRVAFLDYEGPISGGRGMVRCIFRGTYVTAATPDLSSGTAHILKLSLQSGSESTELKLQRATGSTWIAGSDVEGVQQC